MNRRSKSEVAGFRFQTERLVMKFLVLSICLLPSSFSLLKAQSHVPLTVNAGNSTGVCPGDSVKIGGNPSASGGTPPYTYSWQPTTGINNPTASNPYVKPSATTNYTLTVKDSSGNTASGIINVALDSLPIVSAGSDQSILAGTATLLQATGAVNYYWTPTNPLINQNSANPSAEPNATTVFCVQGVDGNGCSNSDCMTLYVIPCDSIFIYNSFTPNGDGYNDAFYLGNIEKYPENKLEVYNRNGKLVFQESPYLNDWFGRIDGTDLPCATYYFILTPGKGKSKVQGSVTIIR